MIFKVNWTELIIKNDLNLTYIFDTPFQVHIEQILIVKDLERDRAEGEAFMAKIKEKEQELKKREEAIAKRAKEAEIIKKIEEKERNLRMKEEKLMRLGSFFYSVKKK